ncbi:MAG: hypothetical protein DRQ62_16020 [Gammaproteobacteria bacterium]|nr:MAG: hypothetical protein DRQ62_16020 [Gammaproteobacteria bacterium]
MDFDGMDFEDMAGDFEDDFEDDYDPDEVPEEDDAEEYFDANESEEHHNDAFPHTHENDLDQNLSPGELAFTLGMAETIAEQEAKEARRSKAQKVKVEPTPVDIRLRRSGKKPKNFVDFFSWLKKTGRN